MHEVRCVHYALLQICSSNTCNMGVFSACKLLSSNDSSPTYELNFIY
jgi:hypothetical protein